MKATLRLPFDYPKSFLGKPTKPIFNVSVEDDLGNILQQVPTSVSYGPDLVNLLYNILPGIAARYGEDLSYKGVVDPRPAPQNEAYHGPVYAYYGFGPSRFGENRWLGSGGTGYSVPKFDDELAPDQIGLIGYGPTPEPRIRNPRFTNSERIEEGSDMPTTKERYLKSAAKKSERLTNILNTTFEPDVLPDWTPLLGGGQPYYFKETPSSEPETAYTVLPLYDEEGNRILKKDGTPRWMPFNPSFITPYLNWNAEPNRGMLASKDSDEYESWLNRFKRYATPNDPIYYDPDMMDYMIPYANNKGIIERYDNGSIAHKNLLGSLLTYMQAPGYFDTFAPMFKNAGLNPQDYKRDTDFNDQQLQDIINMMLKQSQGNDPGMMVRVPSTLPSVNPDKPKPISDVDNWTQVRSILAKYADEPKEILDAYDANGNVIAQKTGDYLSKKDKSMVLTPEVYNALESDMATDISDKNIYDEVMNSLGDNPTYSDIKKLLATINGNLGGLKSSADQVMPTTAPYGFKGMSRANVDEELNNYLRAELPTVIGKTGQQLTAQDRLKLNEIYETVTGVKPDSIVQSKAIANALNRIVDSYTDNAKIRAQTNFARDLKNQYKHLLKQRTRERLLDEKKAEALADTAKLATHVDAIDSQVKGAREQTKYDKKAGLAHKKFLGEEASDQLLAMRPSSDARLLSARNAKLLNDDSLTPEQIHNILGSKIYALKGDSAMSAYTKGMLNIARAILHKSGTDLSNELAAKDDDAHVLASYLNAGDLDVNNPEVYDYFKQRIEKDKSTIGVGKKDVLSYLVDVADDYVRDNFNKRRAEAGELPEEPKKKIKVKVHSKDDKHFQQLAAKYKRELARSAAEKKKQQDAIPGMDISEHEAAYQRQLAQPNEGVVVKFKGPKPVEPEKPVKANPDVTPVVFDTAEAAKEQLDRDRRTHNSKVLYDYEQGNKPKRNILNGVVEFGQWD